MSDLSPTERPAHLTTVSGVESALDAPSVLIVEPELDELLRTTALLSGVGFVVTSATSFTQAKPLLTRHSPGILLTASRLGMYNGLHLVVRGKALQCDLAALVTSRVEDAILQREAEQLGATFVRRPMADRDLIASILKTRYRTPGDTTPNRPPFERRATERLISPLESLTAGQPVMERRRPLPWLVRLP